MIRRRHFESIYQSEAVASGTALGRRATRHAAPSDVSLPRRLSNNGDVSARHVVEAARTGDAAARQLVEAEAKWLRIGFTNLLHLYSPDLIVMGGGLSYGFDLLAPTIRATVEERAMQAYRDVPIVRADLAAWLAKWSPRYPRLTGWAEDAIEQTLTFFRLPRQHHLPLMQPGSLVTQQNLSRLEIDDRATKAVASKASFGRRPDGCRLARLTRTGQA